jgi:hypothetical protein
MKEEDAGKKRKDDVGAAASAWEYFVLSSSHEGHCAISSTAQAAYRVLRSRSAIVTVAVAENAKIVSLTHPLWSSSRERGGVPEPIAVMIRAKGADMGEEVAL